MVLPPPVLTVVVGTQPAEGPGPAEGHLPAVARPLAMTLRPGFRETLTFAQLGVPAGRGVAINSQKAKANILTVRRTSKQQMSKARCVRQSHSLPGSQPPSRGSRPPPAGTGRGGLPGHRSLSAPSRGFGTFPTPLPREPGVGPAGRAVLRTTVCRSSETLRIPSFAAPQDYVSRGLAWLT